MFCIQNITAYAEPKSLLSTNLGTDGHKAAGTKENDMPNKTIPAYAMAVDCVAGNSKAKDR